jgi:hypothetical protein
LKRRRIMKKKSIRQNILDEIERLEKLGQQWDKIIMSLPPVSRLAIAPRAEDMVIAELRELLEQYPD